MWTDAIALTVYAAVVAAGVLSGVHALLHKRDPRSQLGWLVLCVLVPVFGAFFYWLLGVNRIKTRAQRWAAEGHWGPDASAKELQSADPVSADRMRSLLRLAKAVTGRPLLAGNRVDVLHNGEQAYPAMIDAIANAQKTVHLCTYIWETDDVGRQFVDALAAAARRGVRVRALVDAIGERYSRPRVTRLLRDVDGVEVARFLPLVLSLRGLRVNLRNHRKILVVDSEVGFTGGMNIGGRHMVTRPDNPKRAVDIHFRIEGQGVAFLEEAFAADWLFTTGKETGWPGYRPMDDRGPALVRGIMDGPNEDLETLQWVLIGALAAARDRVCIMTPYFIPSREMIAALSSAALRGVSVEILLPSDNNLPFVAWASNACLWEILQHGVRVFFRPPPFAHSKLFLVDDYYAIVGSANIDPRSLRLNFEFNLEIYDAALGASLVSHFDDVRAESREVTLDDVNARPLWMKLRDSTCKLFSPYL
ncbi:MAG: cardiolipin synthase [Deltaproteobacteria bacterium]|nr:MAG: cardiolipin synthase [Deltaproteobacteria bacterium]